MDRNRDSWAGAAKGAYRAYQLHQLARGEWLKGAGTHLTELAVFGTVVLGLLLLRHFL